MTTLARNTYVGAFQLKGGIAVVIEITGFPVHGCVASTTIDLRLIIDHRCELTGMDVPVTPGTIRRQTPELYHRPNCSCINILMA